MNPPPYVDFEVTPEPVGAEPSVWDVEWFDGDVTLLGFEYGPAPAEASEALLAVTVNRGP